MIDLFSWNTPNGERAQIALEEMELDYRVHSIDLSRGEQTDPEFLQVNPNGRIPAIVDQDGPNGEPITIFESGAILIYLAEKTGRFLPGDPRDRASVLQWFMLQSAGLGPIMGQAAHFHRSAPEPIPYAVNRFSDEINRVFSVLDARLAEHDFLAGAYSIADISGFPWIRRHSRIGIDLGPYPHIKRWLEAVESRPAVQRGMVAPCGAPL